MAYVNLSIRLNKQLSLKSALVDVHLLICWPTFLGMLEWWLGFLSGQHMGWKFVMVRWSTCTSGTSYAIYNWWSLNELLWIAALVLRHIRLSVHQETFDGYNLKFSLLGTVLGDAVRWKRSRRVELLTKSNGPLRLMPASPKTKPGQSLKRRSRRGASKELKDGWLP